LRIEVQIVISFGLDVFASLCSCVSTIMEVIMKNLNAITYASVWCGVAFLRRTIGGKTPTQARDGFAFIYVTCQE